MTRIELDDILQPKEDASVAAHELASPRRHASSPGRSASSPVTEVQVAEGTQVLPPEKPASVHANDDTPIEELPPLPADGGASMEPEHSQQALAHAVPCTAMHINHQ